MKFYYLLFIVLLAAACNKQDKKMHTCENTCVQNIINAGGVYNQERYIQIDEYLYNGNTVYLLRADCCDMYDVVLNQSCQVICSPSGGISGAGDGQCNKFYTQATHVKLIWKKP